MAMNSPPSLTYRFPDLERDDRLREMIIYISEKCTDDPTFGVTKLNKILHKADVLSYRRYGRSITGVAYMRLPQGPAPRPMKPLCQDMEVRGEIVRHKVRLIDHDRHQIIPLREPDIDRFSARDIAMVDDVIRAFWGQTAKEVSERSHGRAWRIAPDQALIPYEAVFLSEEDITPTDIRRARELIREHGWDV
jgi:hypothetical protein